MTKAKPAIRSTRLIRAATVRERSPHKAEVPTDERVALPYGRGSDRSHAGRAGIDRDRVELPQ